MSIQASAQHWHPLRNRVLALAAMIQAAHLVQGIARKGMVDSAEMQRAIESILATPGNESIHAGHLYPEAGQLRTGLILLQRLLSGEQVGTDVKQAKEMMAYCAAMMSLERKLSRNRDMLAKLGEGISRIHKQRDYFGGAMHDNVIAALAALYAETISTMTPRIIVHGKPELLNQSSNTNKVRALLFAGIRAAHLWHSHGGGHVQLLLRRRSLGREADRLLHESEHA
ncbi:MAG: lysogenization regulator HflD [Zetaproteobacteria bacterium CG06_land_8_20_14_3_00_59_53]|nr:MAG: hypothetical protein AUK36_05320 [Zetaproteobacteria bacterium CG2_30_59_37]PIO90480.1 MAG: lysogenization regulator HflD [Zetaproteobacteria bacterium CG23_combo_of_CG06-09_8_20_14_all_59_86]PIQ65951.1 MAG: lysogenization regulator HflD [Zetaproteobacteria bacterium CG11_big_fil_rev_8_21_14_0_20_59_439]PIU71431.1 MAG: lysogenization regulator HflD [Zetaproteobacteria bacterium CG06_land_8_20_14_3_00_59_53]PIU97687.1 MAG: lysogenization regulator HflD [Zetaproteobacteria bacterium CG03_